MYDDCKFWVLFIACLLIVKMFDLMVLAFDNCLKIETSLSNIVAMP
jgi:hypothetical protein